MQQPASRLQESKIHPAPTESPPHPSGGGDANLKQMRYVLLAGVSNWRSKVTARIGIKLYMQQPTSRLRESQVHSAPETSTPHQHFKLLLKVSLKMCLSP